MRHFDALGLAEDVEDGVEGVKILAATVVVHGEEEIHGAVGLSGGDVALGEDGEGAGNWAAAEGAHAGQEGPCGVVVAHAGRDVDGVVEGRGGVGVGGVAAQVLEELEGLGPVVPEALQDLVHELWGPFDGGSV